MFKFQKKRKLIEFLNNLESPSVSFPKDYIKYHEVEIDCIKWLIASYEGLAGKPIVYLEALINRPLYNYNDYSNEMKRFKIEPKSEIEIYKEKQRRISFLYYWIYYNKITGF